MEEYLRICKALIAQLDGVDMWAMFGAMAMSLWIQPRQTNDMDFLLVCRDRAVASLAVQHLEFLVVSEGWPYGRREVGPPLDALLWLRLPRMEDCPTLDADFAFVHGDVHRDIVSLGIEEVKFGRVGVPVVGPEGLVVLKLMTTRDKAQDRIDAERLLHEGEFNKALLRRLVKKAGVEKRFTTAAKKAGWDL